MRLSVNKKYLDSKFLYYFFLSSFGQRELLKNASQVGVPAIANPTKSLKDVNVLVPPLEEQFRIVSILSSLDDKIELNLLMNKTLEAIAQAIFKEWFVDFRFPGFDGELVDGLPKGWRKSTLSEAVVVKGGSTPSTTNTDYWDGDNFWATPKDLSSLKSPALLTTERRITDSGVKQISSGVLPKGTLLLSSRAPIGYIAINQMPVSINQGFIAIQGKLVSNIFMLFWLKRNMAFINGRANGSTFQEISKSSFKGIGISIPNTDLLNSFDQIIYPIFDRIVSNEKENQTLIQVRDALLPRLMSGKIRVA
jgi:type I restriction enzyme S subunit